MSENVRPAGGARRMRRLVAACAVTAAAACASPGTPSNGLESAPEVQLWPAGAVLHDPVWSYHSHALVALTDDHRLAEVSAGARPGDATTRFSAPMPVGRNLQISQKDDRNVFVPQPERDRVAVVDLENLRQVGEFDAGPAPAYVTQDAGLRVLLALSANGTSVTPVDEYGARKLPAASITGDPATSIDGANRGREFDYHLYASSGIRHYQGRTSPPPERGSLALDVAVSAGDGTAVSRSYVAGRDSDVLSTRWIRAAAGEGMEVLATARLGSPIRELGTDDFRIYAATDRDVAVLETASFTGFPQRRIPVIRTIDYRAGLPPTARTARLSGMAVGPHRVYLTFQQVPYVVSVAKPRV